MSCSVRGAVTRLWVNGKRIRFIRVDPTETQNPQQIDVSQDTIRGTLNPHDDDVVPGVRIVRFTFRVQPNPSEWAHLVPLMGFTNGGAGTTYTPLTDLTAMEHDIFVDRVTSGEKYEDCIFDKIVGRSQKGATPVTLDISVIAKREVDVDGAVVTFPADNTLFAGRPYVQKNCSLSLDGNAHHPNMVAWGIDHHVDPEYNSSEIAEDICPATREVFFATSTPYITANEAALYTDGRDNPETSISGSVSWGRGNSEFTLTPGALRLLPRPPAIMSRLQEVRNMLFYRALETDAADLLTIEADPTE